MSFTIKLQRNNSEKNRLHKSITDIKSISVEMNSGSSLVDPVLMYDGPLTDVTDCNYITIDDFNRKYFVTDPISYRNGMCEIHCHCDVLSSWIDELSANSGIIMKQQSLYNLFLDDGSMKVYNNPVIVQKAFPGSFAGPEFVLAVSGS